jgi:hypothetical protein
MLLEKSIKSGDVVTLKLTSGEEVISRFEEENSHGYKISKPMVLSMTQKGVGMIPYLFTVNPNTSIVINHSAIAVLSTTDEDFAKQYTTSTTGIQMA